MQRTALVTGGTRGIGAAISKALKAAGHTVAANYAGNDASAQAFSEANGIKVFKFDVSDPASAAAGIKLAGEACGSIDVLVNNAGITRDGFLHKLTYENWSAVIRTNLDSMFNCTKPVIEHMRAQGFGRIVNISSINGQKGQMGQTNYSAAKAGVIGFTKALAQESAAKGITVNCICPGYIDTDMVAAVPPDVLQKIIAQIPAGRLGRAEEVAATVAFLASDHAGFFNGAVFTMNGGQYFANG
jgi:acetoacetyl-CoA reductase